MSTKKSPKNACYAHLIRHGATENNLANPPILQGRSVNGPLSPDGKRQANATAKFLASKPITAVYSSPLKRAHETAEAIAARHGLPVCTTTALAEVDVGDWESRSWVEIEQTETEAYHRFQNDPATHGYRNGENLQQVFDRAAPAIRAVMQDHLGEQIVIVAHNVVNRVLLANALQLPLARARNVPQNNCGVNTIRLREEVFKVITVNSTHHL